MNESVSSTLIYPLTTEPETGTGAAVEIAPGIMWLRMPLFASLKWINVWIIDDERGWAVVDTGLRSAETMDGDVDRAYLLTDRKNCEIRFD